jgi:hypothetical protein
MRKTIAATFAASALVFGTATGSGFAKAPPFSQVCSAASNGGTLVNGVCVLPGATAGGAHDYFGYVIANTSEPSGSDAFSIVSGSLPPGLSMPSHYGAADTVINGVATQTGTFKFVVKAADPDEGLSSLQTYSITVSSPPPDKLVCSPDTNGGTLVNGVCVLPGASVGQGYEGFILTSNNSGGTFSIISGSLPPGLSMPASYGASGTIVAGTPNQQGTFTFTVKGTDQQGQPLQQTYSIAVGPPLPLRDTTVSPFPSGTVGTPYAANFLLSGGEAPYTWSLVSGQLPPGLALVSTDAPTDNNNQLAGTPTTAGTFVFTMKVTDSLGSTATGQVQVTIQPRPPVQINSPTSCCNAGKVGTAYPYIAFGATGGQTPYTWTVASGQVPSGLSFSSGNPGTLINNVLSGTPTKTGTFAFTMKVTDNLGGTATQAFSITIDP